MFYQNEVLNGKTYWDVCSQTISLSTTELSFIGRTEAVSGSCYPVYNCTVIETSKLKNMTSVKEVGLDGKTKCSWKFTRRMCLFWKGLVCL